MNVHGCGGQPGWGLFSELQGTIGLWALSLGLSLESEHMNFRSGGGAAQGPVGLRWSAGVTGGTGLLPSATVAMDS